MAPTGPREAQVRRWRELGPSSRIELGCSLISLGWELSPARDRGDVDEDR